MWRRGGLDLSTSTVSDLQVEFRGTMHNFQELHNDLFGQPVTQTFIFM